MLMLPVVVDGSSFVLKLPAVVDGSSFVAVGKHHLVEEPWVEQVNQYIVLARCLVDHLVLQQVSPVMTGNEQHQAM